MLQSNFKFYKTLKKVPTFKEMKCYFDPPFIGIFQEVEGYYYIIKIADKGFYVMQYDEEYSSMMNGGSIVNDQESKYQADEYFFDEEQSMFAFLLKYDFGEFDIQKVQKLLKKYQKFVKEKDQLIAKENLYYMDPKKLEKLSGYITLRDLELTIKKGEILTHHSDGFVQTDNIVINTDRIKTLQK